MLPAAWFRRIRKHATPRPRVGRRLSVEALEDRLVLSFAAAVNFPVGTRPWAVVEADLNGDGNLDLVTPNNYANTVSVLLGNGDGSFAAAHTYAAGYGPASVAAADFTGDGKLDLVVAGAGYDYVFNGSSVSVLSGNGDGTFSSPITTNSVGSAPIALAVGDFNQDSKQDVAVASRNDNTVRVLLGQGDGLFTPGPTLATDSLPRSIVAADLDGDHQLDLAVACQNRNTVNLFHGSGGGTFSGSAAYTVGTSPESVAALDLNRDGILDIVTANYGSNDVSILLGQSGGLFGSATAFAAGTHPVSVAAADFDGDGVIDLVTANQANYLFPNAYASVLLGNGDGTFLTSVPSQIGPFPFGAVAGDFNGDGKVDLASVNQGGNNVSVLLNDDAWFGAVTTTAGPPTSPHLAVGDFNGDGTPDLVEASHLSLQVLLGNGDGAFSASATFTDSTGSVAVADVNNDGKADLVYIGSPGVIVRLGNGNGTFGLTYSYSLGDAVAVGVGDFDRDGKPDLAVGRFRSFGGPVSYNAIATLRGNGDGTFQAPQLIATGSVSGGIAVGDLNGDGYSDVVSTCPNNFNLSTGTLAGSNVDVLLSTGPGTFAPATRYTLYPYTSISGGSAGTTSPILTDLNGDGKLDLVTVSRNTNSFTVLLNNGNGSFGPVSSQYGAGYVGINDDEFPQRGPVSAAAADFNGDGRTDLVGSFSLTGTATFLINKGAGSFDDVMPVSVGGLPSSVVAADFNRDGAPDVAVADSTTGAVTVLLNSHSYDRPPTITSNGGDATASISVPEGTMSVTTAAASDPDVGQTLT